MTPLDRLAIAAPDDDFSATLRTLVERNIQQLPVMVDGQLVGMLDRRDVARWVEIQLATA